MSVFRKPSELEAKPGIAAMIYGQPGSGKSTLACSAPGAVLVDTDGGVLRIHGAHQVPTLQVKRWEDIAQAMDEAKKDPSVESIVIDTVGKMLAFMEEYIKRTASGKRIELNRDGSLSLKGFGKRKQMFIDFVKGATTMGKNIIFVGHEKEETRGDETVIRPEVGGSSTNDLMKELDLVGYMEINGGKRTISFTPTDRFYAKNTCGMAGVIELPVLIGEDGVLTGVANTFFSEVIDSYRRRVAEGIENNRRFEALKEEISRRASAIEDAAGANAFVEWARTAGHIYSSKAVALSALSARAQSLGLTYDKEAKVYV